MRTYDAKLITEAIGFFLKDDHFKVDTEEWLSNSDNIALTNDRGDLALFEKGIKHVYAGHYYFKSRGKSALIAAREFLDEIFNTCYNIPILIGLTPLAYLGARWLSRQVGFTSHGVIDFNNKHYELFILTKQEFNQ